MISEVEREEASKGEKKEERKMTVACPLCRKRGIQSRVKLLQLNYSEALISCENRQCPFPLLAGHIKSNIMTKRDFHVVEKGVPANNPVSDVSKDTTESSSQSKPASVDDETKESKSISHSGVSDTPDTTVVIKESISDSQLIDQFAKFEFEASVPVEADVKKKQKKKYYTGGRKRKTIKKPITKPENIGIESES